MARGKDVRVYIGTDEQWHVAVNEAAKEKSQRKNTAFKTMEEAQEFYNAQRLTAPECIYPRKLDYFSFTRAAGDGTFIPDWEATKAHGPMPRELDIMFLDPRPLEAEYQLWSSSELRCHGDGQHALRVLKMANTPEEIALANIAKEAGQKVFPIISGCETCGCPYAKPTMKDGKEYAAACKPHARIKFQLLNAPRLGGQCQYDTTSIRSISQLFSCLFEFYRFTGQGDPAKGFVAGIPLKLVLSPFRVNHNGQAGTAYSVSLEFRAESAFKLKQQLLKHAMEFQKVIPMPKQIEAPPPDDEPEETFEQQEPAEAAAFTAEFVDERGTEVVQPGSVDAARQIGIHQIAETYGYSPNCVEEFYDQPNCMELLDLKYGPPPKNLPPVAERVQKEMDAKAAKKAGTATTQPEETQPLFGKEPTPIREVKKPFEGFGKKK
jgi:hypothetical protein